MDHSVVFGNHIGLVINSNDPEQRNRVQVYVPYLSTTVYKEWNDLAVDRQIRQGDVSSIEKQSPVISIEKQSPTLWHRLKELLPWAEAAMPLFGIGGTSYSDKLTKLTKIQPSGATKIENFLSYSTYAGRRKGIEQNSYNTSIETWGNFVGKARVIDSTTSIKSTDIRTSQGIVSAPLEGTMVWVFFLGGDVQKPVYFAGVTETNVSIRNDLNCFQMFVND